MQNKEFISRTEWMSLGPSLSSATQTEYGPKRQSKIFIWGSNRPQRNDWGIQYVCENQTWRASDVLKLMINRALILRHPFETDLLGFREPKIGRRLNRFWSAGSQNERTIYNPTTRWTLRFQTTVTVKGVAGKWSIAHLYGHATWCQLGPMLSESEPFLTSHFAKFWRWQLKFGHMS